MSFRKNKNRHDLWQEHINVYANEVIELQIPSDLLKNEASFEYFLKEGNIVLSDHVKLDMTKLSNEQFVLIENIVKSWFEEMVGGQDYLIAFCSERTIRFNRYG